MKKFVSTVQTVTPDDARKMLEKGSTCAWEGCKSKYPGRNMPHGWRYLLTYWAGEPVLDFNKIKPGNVQRDGVLCPEHARALESQLKDLGTRLIGEYPAGEA